MPRSQIIALTGYAGVGKDTVADLLVRYMGYRKLAFADALRAEVSEGFGVELSYLTHPSTKHQPMAALSMRRAPRDFLAYATINIAVPREPDGRIAADWLDAPRTPRQILQWWGTEYRRSQQPSYWTALMRLRLLRWMSRGETHFVVSDCRFANEVDTLLALGARLWQITRPGIDASTTPEGPHASATDGAAFKPDLVITNSQDIPHLQHQVLGAAAAVHRGLPGAQVSVTP